jgi:predicted O-methyltransferase YrrM
MIRDVVRFWTPNGFVKKRRIEKPVPAPVILPQFTLPQRSLAELFPQIASVNFTLPISRITNAPDSDLPLVELLTMMTVCQGIKPKRIFEIGTYTGATTLALADCTPADAEIYTIDLPPQDAAAETKIGSAFRNTVFANKIHQLWGDSKKFDFTPYAKQFDLVFVDAAHDYESVKSDTETALQLVCPGGTIVWDDYFWMPDHPHCQGVTRCVDEFAETRTCYRIQNTRLAIHQTS